LDVLMISYELGKQIKTIDLRNCISLYVDNVADLEQVVSKVEWDGIEEEREDSEEEDEDEDHRCSGTWCDCGDERYEVTYDDLMGEDIGFGW